MSDPHDPFIYDTDNENETLPVEVVQVSKGRHEDRTVSKFRDLFSSLIRDSDSSCSPELGENHNKMAGGRQTTRCPQVPRKWLLQSWKLLFVLLPAVALLLLYNGYIVQRPEPRPAQPLLPVLSDQTQNDFQADNSSHSSGVNSTKSLSRFIVYSCNKITVCGGWADRQKGIVVTYLIALMMNRKFRIDMPRPCDLQFFLVPNKVDWVMRPGETEGHSISEIEAIDGHGLNFVDKLLKKDDLSIPEMDADYVVITANMDTVNKLKMHPLAKTVPLLSNETSVPEIYQTSLDKLFTLSSGLRKTLDVAMESRPPDTKLVCAQVRMGGAGKDYNDSESFNSMAEVKNLMDFLSKYNDSTKYRMYFTSDSQQVVELGQATFPNLVIKIPGPITHVDKSKGSDACAGFGHVIVEQTALSSCDVLVISESGVGKIAAFLRSTDKELYLFHNGKIEPFRRDMRFPNRSW